MKTVKLETKDHLFLLETIQDMIFEKEEDLEIESEWNDNKEDLKLIETWIQDLKDLKSKLI